MPDALRPRPSALLVFLAVRRPGPETGPEQPGSTAGFSFRSKTPADPGPREGKEVAGTPTLSSRLAKAARPLQSGAAGSVLTRAEAR